MAVKQVERSFWAHIIMHMRNMRIIAIIMLLVKYLSMAQSLSSNSEYGVIICQ